MITNAPGTSGGGGGSVQVLTPTPGNNPTAAVTSATAIVDLSLAPTTGNTVALTLTSSVPSLIFVNAIQDATGSRNLTINGTAITGLNQTAGLPTMIAIPYDGTTFYLGSVNAGVISVNGQRGPAAIISAAALGLSLDQIATANPTLANVPMSGFTLTGVGSATTTGEPLIAGQGFRQIVGTGNAGVALTNATQTLLSTTTPNDGNLHSIALSCDLDVTSATTGGVIQTEIAGGAGMSPNLFSGTLTAAWHGPTPGTTFALPANTAFAVVQTSAMTAGAAVFYGEIFGDW